MNKFHESGQHAKSEYLKESPVGTRCEGYRIEIKQTERANKIEGLHSANFGGIHEFFLHISHDSVCENMLFKSI